MLRVARVCWVCVGGAALPARRGEVIGYRDGTQEPLLLYTGWLAGWLAGKGQVTVCVVWVACEGEENRREGKARVTPPPLSPEA